MSGKIKKKNSPKQKIKIPAETTVQTDYPVFCFRHIQSTPGKDHRFYTEFIVRLQKISQLTWNQVITTQRHGFGTKKLPVGQIKVRLPDFVTPDVTHLTVFRANGDNRPFLGLRNGSIFHIIFLEERFGDIYDHECSRCQDPGYCDSRLNSTIWPGSPATRPG